MGYLKLSTGSYRNLKDQEVSLDAPRILLVGENGQGKSNFLEAVYLLSYGSSFRTRSDAEIVTHGAKEAFISGNYARPEDDFIPGRIALRVSGREKEVFLNEKKLSDRKDLISTMPAIVFTHDDISMISGPPDRRRWFFNQTMSLFDPLFIDLLRTYRKILKMRNAALKEGQTGLLDAYDRQLAEQGGEIQRRRGLVCVEFSELFTPLFTEVSGLEDPLTVEYRPSWIGGSGEACEGGAGAAEPPLESIVKLLKERRQRDLDFGTSTSGPHRDRFLFRYRNRDFTKIASTGQLRLISLLLRLGQCRYFTAKTGRKPVLLLDDVLLELDAIRRERFLLRLPDCEQAFFTFLPNEEFSGFSDDQTRIFRVEDGWIRSP